MNNLFQQVLRAYEGVGYYATAIDIGLQMPHARDFEGRLRLHEAQLETLSAHKNDADYPDATACERAQRKGTEQAYAQQTVALQACGRGG